MSKQEIVSARNVRRVLAVLQQLPPNVRSFLIAAALVAVMGVGLFLLFDRIFVAPRATVPPGSFVFCSWNVENFFDDEDDPKNDDKLEDWFAHHPDMFRLKVEHLAEILLKMNAGRGPDILAMYEVESERCMTALQSALNERLPADAKYEHVLFLGDKMGRRFAPGILTRLPVEANRTRKITNNAGNGRTIEGHINVNGHELVVLAAHWTSRLDRGNGHDHAERRMSYAKDCYGRFRAILTNNADADVILCGDFNDEFKDPSMQNGLFASADPQTVVESTIPRPLALFALWPATDDPPGTIFGKGHWSIFDHICLSRGLLDGQGWSCDPASRNIFATPDMRRKGPRTHGEPFRFGEANATEHGYSDHFPVTAVLKMN